MDFKVAYDRLKEVTNQGNIVIKVDGKERRLFASENGSIGEYKKGARKWGFRVALDEVEKWKTLEVHAKVTDKLKFKRLCDIVRKMEKSGLWPDLCKTYRGLVSLGFNEFKKYINLDYSARQNYRKQHDFGGDVDCLDYTLLKGLKQINFQNKQDKDAFNDALGRKEDYKHSWRKGYDNKINYDAKNSMCWYNEEYKDCANGHYYLIISPTQAIFCEDD